MLMKIVADICKIIKNCGNADVITVSVGLKTKNNFTTANLKFNGNYEVEMESTANSNSECRGWLLILMR